MKKLNIVSVVGARPNFIKLIPVHNALQKTCTHTIIHTGQHYDFELSETFFKEFDLPKPFINLEVGSGTGGYQIGEIIKRLEPVFESYKFDCIIVYGDTNSTLGGAIAAKKFNLKVAHIESGLRSFDSRMPEETNRIITDRLSDYLFAPTKTAVNNLKKEKIAGKIFYTGDLSVELIKDTLKKSSNSKILNELQLESKNYILVTMHRAENTNSVPNLISIINAFEKLSDFEFIFPIHPRTEKILKETKLYTRFQSCKNLKLIQPVGYIDFVVLMRNAMKIITDSGGIQKESYLLNVPCITIRRNTEWVETVKAGWNIITDTNTNKIIQAVKNWSPQKNKPAIFGKGNTSSKITKSLFYFLQR